MLLSGCKRHIGKAGSDLEDRPNVVIKREGTSTRFVDCVLLHRKGTCVISMNESFSRDSIIKGLCLKRKGPPGEFFRFLYSVDSLQDSLRGKEIDSAFRIAFRKEGMNVPISISRNANKLQRERIPAEEMRLLNKVTIGFAHPVTYEIKPWKHIWLFDKKNGFAYPVFFISCRSYGVIFSFTLPKPATPQETY